MTDNPEVRGYEVTCDLVGSEDQHVFGMNTKAFAELTATGDGAAFFELIRLTDHEAARAADKARIAELERERDEWHRLFDSAGQVAKNACDDRDSHQRVCMRVIQERDELAEALRVFTGAACPCAIQINSKGYSWSGAYLDEALAVAAPLLAQQGKEGGE